MSEEHRTNVAAPFLPNLYTALLVSGGAIWSAAFALFAIKYGPMLLRPALGK